MNIALAKLVVDLLAQSLKTSALPLFWLDSESPSHLHCCRLPGLNPQGRERKNEAAGNEEFHGLWNLIIQYSGEFQRKAVSTAVVFFEFGCRSIRLIVLSICAYSAEADQGDTCHKQQNRQNKQAAVHRLLARLIDSIPRRAAGAPAHSCLGGAFDHILGGAADPAGAALHGIGPGSFRPARTRQDNAVTELKQGSTQPAGHSFEQQHQCAGSSINAVVPNDTKGLGALKLLWTQIAAVSSPRPTVRPSRCSMPIQAQIRPSSMSSTGLSDASVVTSEGAGMRFGMPLIC